MRNSTLSITSARGGDEQRERLGRIGRLLNDLAEEVEALRSEVAELAVVPAPSAPSIHQRLLTVVEVAGAIGVGQSTVHSLTFQSADGKQVRAAQVPQDRGLPPRLR